jgi:hypothetical protein
MTPDLMRALGISGSILIGVVIVIIILSFVTVRRGEVEMTREPKGRGGTAHH